MSKIVLCVDDSTTMQQVADITFRGTEFTYVGARSYEEGLDKAKSHKPAVILADSAMPGGKSGYDLCLALKSNDATSDVPVVILIGNGAPYDSAKGIQVGADANLPKPWDTQTMLDRVVEVVSKAAAGVAKPGQGVPGGAAASTGVPVVVPVTKSSPIPQASPSSSSGPRSATIMGMPTIKLPAGVATTVSVAPVAAKPAVVAVPPIAAPPVSAPLNAPTRTPAPAPALNTSSRAPMISGTPTKRSAIVERTLAKMAARLAEATGLDPGSPELLALLKLSTEVVERIVWEVVPDLAEQIIRENLSELTARRG